MQFQQKPVPSSYFGHPEELRFADSRLVLSERCVEPGVSPGNEVELGVCLQALSGIKSNRPITELSATLHREIAQRKVPLITA
jgi:hypothetical protein